MDSTDIETFLAIARTGNVSTAALALHTTQSTLSKRIKGMEEALKVELFVRGKGQKSVELTYAGIEFMELAQRWQGLWQDMHGIRHIQASPSLNIGVMDSIQALTVHLSPALYQRSPDIRIRIQVRDSASMYDEIDKRSIDIGFSHLEREMPSVKRRRLLTEPFVVLSSEKLAPDGEDTVNISALDPDTEVFVRWWSSGYVAWHESYWELHRSRRLCTNSVHLQLAFLGSLGTWGIMPYSLARRASEMRPFHLYKITPEPPPRVCYFLEHRRPRSGVKDVLNVFYECLEETLRNDMPWATIHVPAVR